MSKRLKDAINYSDLYMKRKASLQKYKDNVFGEKSKKALGFPSTIYRNWQAHWTLDDEKLGIPDIRFHPIVEEAPKKVVLEKESD